MQNPQTTTIPTTTTTTTKALDGTIAFPTMVSESGKLESTVMNRAHNGLTNISFVSKIKPLFKCFGHHSAGEMW